MFYRPNLLIYSAFCKAYSSIIRTEIRNITLAADDPGDMYMGEIPVIDEFGQHNLVDFPEKIRSLEQLKAEYYDKPRKDLYDEMYAKIGLPYLIGEFHFGAVDRGLSQSLWQVDTQEERAVGYRYYMEQGFTHPALIGTTYFTWSDQDMSGRGDGENFNCGVVDVTDRPYKLHMEAILSLYVIKHH